MSFMATFPLPLQPILSEDDAAPPERQTVEELEKERLKLSEELHKIAEKIGEINERINRLRGSKRPKQTP
jgi:prefoldin subunit 5